MKITQKALHRFLHEAIKGNRIISERPWSVEYTFSMKGSSADDSEGSSADGFAVVMSSESGVTMRVIVDAYWNPQTGDQSGNSIKVEVDGKIVEGGTSYVPRRFDDGTKQRILISNSPVANVITVSHADADPALPIVYLAVQNPFGADDNDIEWSVDTLGAGDVDVSMSKYINI